jgi:hypothetical protein
MEKPTGLEPRTHIRPAQSGDICVLLEPNREEEIAQLRERQTTLQRLYGGSLIKHVHLTCQRFACADERLVQEFVQRLRQIVTEVKPFTLTALSLETRYVQVRETNVLKWRVEETAELRRFAGLVEEALEETGIASLYAPGFVTCLVTALREVPELGAGELARHGELPYPLFDAGKVILSRILGPNAFEILATVEWCPR